MNKLLRVVEPDFDESCMGWPLRLAGVNHLSSPWHLFRVAGLSQSNMCVLQFQADKLSKLTGLPVSRLDPIACSESDVRSARVVFRGHDIGRKLIRNRTPRVCPHCIGERQIALAAWDLQAVVACPRHRVMLVERCHDCKQRYSWIRPSVRGCRCGADMSKAPTDPAPAGAVLACATIEVAMLRNASAWPAEEDLPQALLDKVANTPLQQVVSALAQIARLAGVAPRNYPSCLSTEVIQGAGVVLQGWPTSLHSLLEDFAARRMETSRMRPRHQGELGAADVLTCELTNYIKWSKKRSGVDRDFVADEMLRYIAKVAPHTTSDPRNLRRLQDANTSAEWISSWSAAKRLNVHLETLHDMLASGLLESKTETRGKVRRVLVKVSSLTAELRRDRMVGLRETNRVTGLPVTVLESLKASDHLPHDYKGPGAGFIAAQDLETFKRKWSEIPTVKMRPDAEGTSVFEALRWKHAHHELEWKAELIRRILEGKIRTYSISTSPTLDATVDTASLLDLRTSFLSTRLGLGQTADLLALSPIGLMQLAAAGKIKPVFDGNQVFFSQVDLQSFRSNYVRLSTLVSSTKTGAELAARCADAGIATLDVTSRRGQVTYAPRSAAVALVARLKQAVH